MYITILEEIELNFYFPFEKRDRIMAYFSITFRLLQCNTITFIHAQGSKIGTTVNRNTKKCLLVGPIRLPLMNGLSVKCVQYKKFLVFHRNWIKLGNNTSPSFIKLCWNTKKFSYIEHIYRRVHPFFPDFSPLVIHDEKKLGIEHNFLPDLRLQFQMPWLKS